MASYTRTTDAVQESILAARCSIRNASPGKGGPPNPSGWTNADLVDEAILAYTSGYTAAELAAVFTQALTAYPGIGSTNQGNVLTKLGLSYLSTLTVQNQLAALQVGTPALGLQQFLALSRADQVVVFGYLGLS